MSALTDLFTALANKIRSKTGGSDTYTPPQMVAAIDDVYDAGVAAGTTPTQTKSAGPNVSTNKDVTPDSGYLLSKVTITPLSHTGTYTPAANTAANDMGQYHDKRYVNTSGMIIPTGNKSITANGTGIDVSGYATASVNVPNPTLSGDATTSDVLFGKTFYNSDYTKRTGTITSKAAATYNTSSSDQTISSGQYLSGTQTIKAVTTENIVAANIKSGVTIKVGDANSAGRIKNVTGTYSGYNYGWNSSTLLWNNTSPSSSFTAKTITLNSNINSYRYLRIRTKRATSLSEYADTIVSVSDFISSNAFVPSSSAGMKVGLMLDGGSLSSTYIRRLAYSSNTQIYISACLHGGTNVSTQTTDNSILIPYEIYGLV